jgi:hypothetical protein
LSGFFHLRVRLTAIKILCAQQQIKFLIDGAGEMVEHVTMIKHRYKLKISLVIARQALLQVRL